LFEKLTGGKKPSKPQGPLRVMRYDDKSLTLSWGHNASDGSCPISFYVLEICEDTARNRRIQEIRPDSVDGPNLTALVQGLNTGQFYRFKVTAVNTNASSEVLETRIKFGGKGRFEKDTSFELVKKVYTKEEK
jgi:hypothetical protein